MSRGLRWDLPLAALVFTAAGAAVGWYAARPEPAPADDHEDEHEHDAALSPATLANLGVEVGRLELGTYVETTSVAAVVRHREASAQPLFAPFAGRVESVAIEEGDVARPGTIAITLVRAPLPPPELTLTAPLLEPAQESLHERVLDLRRSAEELSILETELARIAPFTEVGPDGEPPTLPRQRAIDLSYDVARARMTYERVALELESHGFTEEQISAVEAGATIPEPSEARWKSALEHNGLWTEHAERIHAALPSDVGALPWVVGTIGELVASGKASAALADWLESDARASRSFLDVGVLLLDGHTLDDLARLVSEGALEPRVEVRVPGLDEPTAAWDVVHVDARVGQTVERGEELARLLDPREVWLRVQPVGGEIGALLEAGGAPLRARPLLPGTGPELEGLTLAFVRSAQDGPGSEGFVAVANEVLATSADGSSRSWSLRDGERYVVELPLHRHERVYVLPIDAVAKDGPNEVVFLADGDSFRPVPVVVTHRDAESVVVPAIAEVQLYPDDPVVISGAFALGLALNAGDAAADAHGHAH